MVIYEVTEVEVHLKNTEHLRDYLQYKIEIKRGNILIYFL